MVGISAGGNVGTSAATASEEFDADLPAVAEDGDLTTDGKPDMTVVGSPSGTPKAGLWTATGDKASTTGAFVTAAKNVGTDGPGFSTTGTAADFTGSQSLIGHFRGAEVNDVLTYFPTTVANSDGSSTPAGAGVIRAGNADGSLLPTEPGENYSFAPDDLTNPLHGLATPSVLVNGGNLSGHVVAGGLPVPDLIGIAGSGTAAEIEVIPSDGSSPGGYGPARSLLTQVNSTTLVAPPIAGTSWATWRIASAQTASGPVLFLWQPGVTGVWRWSGLVYSDDDGLAAVLSIGASVKVSTAIVTATSTAQAVDVSGDTAPDLRVVTNTGVATTHLSNAAGTVLTGQTSQTLTW